MAKEKETEGRAPAKMIKTEAWENALDALESLEDVFQERITAGAKIIENALRNGESGGAMAAISNRTLAVYYRGLVWTAMRALGMKP